MKLVLKLSAPLALVLLPAPALAQGGDEAAEMEQALAAMTQGFTVEPLTPEQEARLPQAQALVARIMPQGVMSQMMGGMFEGTFSPLIEAAPPQPGAVVLERLGLQAEAFGLSEEQIAAAAQMLDPAWEERNRREIALLPVVMSRMTEAMEPALRQAMAELYAIHFTEQELRDIDAFFATPSGASYASQSYAMMSDQRLAAASMAILPAITHGMAEMEVQMTAATADLPSPRGFAELTANQRKTLANMLGFTVEDLQAQMEWTADPEGYYGSAQKAADAAASAAIDAAASAGWDAAEAAKPY